MVASLTPTEGAAVAAFYALLASALLYRSVTLPQLYEAILNSSKATTSIGMLIAGAMAFNYVVTIEQIPLSLQHFIGGFQLTAGASCSGQPYLLLVLGCLLEGTTILLVVVPILIPTAKALGIDLVYFGVVVVVNIMIGLVTPPYGLLLFVSRQRPNQSLGSIVREALPFIVAALLVLAFITAVPESVLWLPGYLRYKG